MTEFRPAERPEPERVALPFGTFLLHDLSPVFEEGMPGWHSHPKLRIDSNSRNHPEHGYFAQTLHINEHTGSHVDAPAHTDPRPDAATVDVLALGSLIGVAKKYDFGPYNLEAGDLVSLEVVREVERRSAFELERGDIALLDFGWERYLQAGSTAHDTSWWGRNEPGLEEEACRYFADAGIRAIGSDTAGCDAGVRDGVTTGNFGHDAYFLPRGILIVEGLKGLQFTPTIGVFLALPLRIRGGSGSPIRPIMLEPCT